MTEQQIERTVERRLDTLDARLMAGEITQDEYERESQAIGLWADLHYQASFERSLVAEA